MTDKISDAAQGIFAEFLKRFGIEDANINSIGLCENELRHALTAARQEGAREMQPFVELAEMVVENYYGDGGDEQSVAQTARRLLAIRSPLVEG